MYFGSLSANHTATSRSSVVAMSTTVNRVAPILMAPGIDLADPDAREAAACGTSDHEAKQAHESEKLANCPKKLSYNTR